jgi:hypothetical protein
MRSADKAKSVARHTAGKPEPGQHQQAATIEIVAMVRAFFAEGEGLYYVESPHLELVEAARTPELALEFFRSAFRFQVEGWLERGMVEQRLRELGFKEFVSLEQTGQGNQFFFSPKISATPEPAEHTTARRDAEVLVVPLRLEAGVLTV